MRYFIQVREYILDNGEFIAAVISTVVMGFLIGGAIGTYLAGGF